MNKRKMYIRMITASLLRRRSRMIIALLAIAIGATILSGLLTIYYDVPRQMGAQFRSYGANMLFAASEDGFLQKDIDDAAAIIDASKIVGMAPYHYETVRVNDRPVMAAATDMEGARATSPFWRVYGQWPSDDSEIMIGKNVASTYRLSEGDRMTVSYTPEDADEETLDSYKDFTVSGVLDTGGKEEDYVYMTIPAMEELTEKDITYDVCDISVTAQSDELRAYADDITAQIPAINARLVKRVTESETTVLNKLQALVVAERRKEIGLRKALGASNRSIVEEFMGEGMVLGACGGLLGAFLGFVFAQAVSVNVFNSSIILKPWLIPLTMIVSVLVTAIACLIPIRSATYVDPALVLKGE